MKKEKISLNNKKTIIIKLGLKLELTENFFFL